MIGENAQFLTDLDAAIGDADHGINMDRGMTAVIEALDSDEAAARRHGRAVQTGRHDAGEVGRRGQRPAVRHVLPADGRVRWARATASTRRSSPRPCAPVSRVWCSAAAQRRATRRCSTRWRRRWTRSTPRWHPAAGLAAALADATVAAEKGRDATESMVARKGRASYLGQRSVGHHGPGRDVGGDADRGRRVGVRHRWVTR